MMSELRPNIRCGNPSCRASISVPVNQREALAKLRLHGWSIMGEYGWYCPRCIHGGDGE